MEGTATISLDDYERLKRNSEKLGSLEKRLLRMCEIDMTEYKTHMKKWEENPEEVGDTDEEIDKSFAQANREAVKKIALRVEKEPLKQLLKEIYSDYTESEESYLLEKMEKNEIKEMKIKLI